MKRLGSLVFACTLLAGPAIALEQTAKQREDHLAYMLAAAKAEGDPATDLAMERLLQILVSAPEPAVPSRSQRELALLEEVRAVQARLREHLDSDTSRDPRILANDLGCWPVATAKASAPWTTTPISTTTAARASSRPCAN